MLNSKNLPSTVSLKYFVESAKHLSFTRASEKLYITQAAISKQVKQLEELLGVDLFIREKQRIYLTPAGNIYYKDAVRALKELEKLTLKIRAYNSEIDEINIGILPTFASRFLIPLLPSLYEQHPEIRVKLITELNSADFSQQPYDVVISFNEVEKDDVITYTLLGETLIPVCSPKLINSNNRLTLNQLEKLPLLYFSERPNLWNEWFNSVNRTAPPPSPGLTFENFQMLIHASISGLGIALIPEFMITNELKNEQLRKAHSRAMHSKPRYFMAIPKEKFQDEKIIKFVDWLNNTIKTIDYQ